ncbi:Crp/Fnr family transcriptional regulator [Apibacter muscae]|uniref:Crp/Fnr family transcriptional regulator n=1 Tax=Apibacter muscae TaxID=2509004 RepID=UPI0011ADE394|nr:Crp/Fnr family transcriptional regulator [Apibacter muscae]TWP30843.1 Crp/Fnr family transcriptional regulator [Apibacter muscae]
MHLSTIITSIYNIPNASLDKIVQLSEEIKYPKKYLISEEGTIKNSTYFLSKGLVRAFSTINGKETTFWIGTEGHVICSMRNYVENKPSYESIETLENCLLYKINNLSLEKLFLEDIHIANWGRKFIEKEIIKTENQLIFQLFHSGRERYQYLLKNHPELLQRVPLGIIASYLGMSQVSLSRIRANK